MSTPIKLRLKKVAQFETSDGSFHGSEAAGLAHEAKIQLRAAYTAAYPSTAGFSNEQIDDLLSAIVTPAGAEAISRLSALVTAYGKHIKQVATTQLVETNPAPTAAGVVFTDAELKDAKKLVKKYEGKKGRKPDAHAKALTIVEAAKAAAKAIKDAAKAGKKKATAKPSTAKATPAARKPRASAKSPVVEDATMNFAEASRLVSESKGKKGPKSGRLKMALAFLEKASKSAVGSEAPKVATAPALTSVGAGAPPPTAPPPLG